MALQGLTLGCGVRLLRHFETKGRRPRSRDQGRDEDDELKSGQAPGVGVVRPRVPHETKGPQPTCELKQAGMLAAGARLSVTAAYVRESSSTPEHGEQTKHKMKPILLMLPTARVLC
jgi:hypothetical protein